MYSLSRNSCATAFGNWSKRSDLRPKKSKGRGRGPFNPPLEASRVNYTNEIMSLSDNFTKNSSDKQTGYFRFDVVTSKATVQSPQSKCNMAP